MKSGVNGLDHRLSFRHRNSALVKPVSFGKTSFKRRHLNVSERDKQDKPGHWLAFSKLGWSLPIPDTLIIDPPQISSFHSAKLSNHLHFPVLTLLFLYYWVTLMHHLVRSPCRFWAQNEDQGTKASGKESVNYVEITHVAKALLTFLLENSAIDGFILFSFVSYQ